jgi:hypothetical protein
MIETSGRLLLAAEVPRHLFRQLFDLLVPWRVELEPVAQAVVVEELVLTDRQSRQVREIATRKLTALRSLIHLSPVASGPMRELASVF